jgi:hypothetical protein
LHKFFGFQRSKYDHIPVDDARVNRHRNLPLGWRDFLSAPITEEELKMALSKGVCNKDPGRNVMCLVFFEVNWDSIKDDVLASFNQIYLEVPIIQKEKHGTLMCIPKTDIPTTPAGYRQIIWLKTEYKIFACIRTNRQRPALSTCYTRV